MSKPPRPKYSYRGTAMIVTWPKCRHYRDCLKTAEAENKPLKCNDCAKIDIPVKAPEPEDETA